MTQTNAQRRQRGIRRLEVWVPEKSLERLDALCEDSGYSRADLIASMIDTDWAALPEKKRHAAGSR